MQMALETGRMTPCFQLDPVPESLDCSSSSSIGSASANTGSGGKVAGDDEEDDGEVESSYNPLAALDALEESLPLKRGISKFYNGKSKSFTTLAEAVTLTTARELRKPENAYTRKRKNLLAISIICCDDNGRGLNRLGRGKGIAKRFMSCSSTCRPPLGKGVSSGRDEGEFATKAPRRKPDAVFLSSPASFSSRLDRSVSLGDLTQANHLIDSSRD